LGSWVGSAVPIADQLDLVDQNNRFHWGHPAVRASALMLLAQGGATFSQEYLASRVTYFFRQVAHHGGSPSDGLMVASVLAAVTGDSEPVKAAFLWIRAELARGPPFAGAPALPIDLAAACLADLPMASTPEGMARMAEMSRALGTNDPLAVAMLVRSGSSLTDAVTRFRAATEALRGLGYSDGSIPTSAAMLASSLVAAPSFAARLSQLDPWARGSFPSPAIAAALLGSLLLAPSEALLLQKYAVGRVSAGSFFDETPEIDYLALLVVSGIVRSGTAGEQLGLAPPANLPELTPLGGAGGAWTVPESAPLPSSTPAGALGATGAVLLPALFAGQAYWLYQAYFEYTRQHPVHSNLVPIYG
jgi:hypothetical protein